MNTPTGTLPPPSARPYQPFQQSNDVTLGEWFVTLLLTYIPIVNIVMLLIWAFGSQTNLSKANWAKATLIWIAIGIVFAVLLLLVVGTALVQSVEMME